MFMAFRNNVELTFDLNIKGYVLLSFAKFVHLHCVTAIDSSVFRCRIFDNKVLSKGTVVYKLSIFPPVCNHWLWNSISIAVYYSSVPLSKADVSYRFIRSWKKVGNCLRNLIEGFWSLWDSSLKASQPSLKLFEKNVIF